MVLDPSADAAHRILSEEKMTKGTDTLRTAGKQLERHTRNEKFLGNAHCILKYFSPKNYAEVDDARAKRGAARSGRGIENKGTALVRKVTAASDEPSGGPSSR
jgi:hypothetical protein